MKTKPNMAVRLVRNIIGRTQTEFAAMLGVTKDAVVSWELGRNRLSRNSARIISAATGVRTDDLLNPRADSRTVRDWKWKPYSAESFSVWKSVVGKAETSTLARMDQDLRLLILAASRPGPGKLKHRIPAVVASFFQWASETEERFKLSHDVDQILKEKDWPGPFWRPEEQRKALIGQMGKAGQAPEIAIGML